MTDSHNGDFQLKTMSELALVTMSCPGQNGMLAAGLWNMCQSNVGVDFDLGCGLWAHRCVLDVFLSPDRLVKGGATQSIAVDSLKSIIEFLYTGRVTVQREKLTSLLEAASNCRFQLLVDTITNATHIGSAGSRPPVQQPPEIMTLVQPSSFRLATIEKSELTEPEASSTMLREFLSGEPVDPPGGSILPDVGDENDCSNESSFAGLGSPMFETVDAEKLPLLIKPEPPDTADGGGVMPPDGLAQVGSGLLLRLRSSLQMKLSEQPVPVKEELPVDEELEEEEEPSEDVTAETLSEENDGPSSSDHDDSPSVTWCQMPNRKPSKLTRMAADDRERPHRCEECGKGFSRRDNLVVHVRTHTRHRPFACSVCGQSFALQFARDSHQRLHDDIKPHVCSDCGLSFDGTSELEAHCRIHIVEKMFECKTCGKVFTSSRKKIRHQRSHSVQTPFECHPCGKFFSSSGNLGKHSRTHTGERPFECKTCGKYFTLAGNLKVHSRTHTGEKPFVCSVCSKSFALAGNLKSHERTHTGEKPYVCACGKSFARVDTLNGHAKSHLHAKKKRQTRPYSLRMTPLCLDSN